VAVIMGVAGAGKTTLGRRLAAAVDWTFRDADDQHSEGNLQRMSAGIALTEADREPWLSALEALISRHLGKGEPLVLACSALRAPYRSRLRAAAEAAGGRARFAYLHLDPATARNRAASRAGHFLPAGLVESQFAALEPPDDALSLDATLPVDTLVRRIRAAWEI
jgi:gluconokinase